MYIVSKDLSEPQLVSQGHVLDLFASALDQVRFCLLCYVVYLLNIQIVSTVFVTLLVSQFSLMFLLTPLVLVLFSFMNHRIKARFAELMAGFDQETAAVQLVEITKVAEFRLPESTRASVIETIAQKIHARAFAQLLQAPHDEARAIISERFPVPRLVVCDQHGFFIMIEYHNEVEVHMKGRDCCINGLANNARFLLAKLNPSATYNSAHDVAAVSFGIKGEILNVLEELCRLQLPRLSLLTNADNFLLHCPKILHLSLETLMKTQSDEVRINCIALLTVLAQSEHFKSSFADSRTSRKREADNFKQAELPTDGTSMILLFAEAIKGPLLSSDNQVQIGTLELILHCLSWEGTGTKHIELLIEQNIADYVIEVLRFSGTKEAAVNSCIRVLSLLSLAEHAFSQRLAVGFSTLIPVLRYVAEVPFHPVQTHTLKLISICIANCPGIISSSQAEELVLVLKSMFRRHTSGEMGMISDAFTISCSIFVAILKSPTARGITNLTESLQEALRNAIPPCLCSPMKQSDEVLLHSLYFLKEAYAYSCIEHPDGNLSDTASADCIIEICEAHLLPWIKMALDEVHGETTILGALETFHSIMSQGSNAQVKRFTEILVSSSWFTLSFGLLGLFPIEKMKWRVYLMLSSMVDEILGNNSGQPIRDAASYLPSDPLDLLFLLGQKSSNDSNLISCQSAVLLILYASSLYDESLAEETQVMASLEQYILVNHGNILFGVDGSATLMKLIHLYGLFRNLTNINQVPYSVEAEKLLFHLAKENDWDLLCARSHPISLKWMLEQEEIIESLSNQFLDFCRLNSRNGSGIIVHGHNNHTTNIHTIAELVAAGGNFGAALLVNLLKQLQEGQEEEIILLVNFMTLIINISPTASDQLCMHGIGNAIQSLHYHSNYYSSPLIFMNSLVLIFNLLHSAKPESFTDEEAWLSLSMKLMEVSTKKMESIASNQEDLLILGILSLILDHSINKTLTEASKSILLSTPLASSINKIVQEACSRGPALVEHNEETSTGEILISVLSLYYFSLQSQQALLLETPDWQFFLGQYGLEQPVSVICIHCHDLCRLMHFGSPLVKLLASYCLLELITRISDQINKNFDELKCSVSYLKSVMAVLEGLVFDSDTRVATNNALCLSMIMGWEKLSKKMKVIRDTKWCRQVVEELVLSLASPGLEAKSFTDNHKALTHVSVALLRLDQVPKWMKFVFDDSSISRIIQNISVNNLSTELAQLCRELLNYGYLKAEHIADLNRVFQECRTQIYTSSSHGHNKRECTEKVLIGPDDLDKVSGILLSLVSSHSSPSIASKRVQPGNVASLEEIEMFFQESSKFTVTEKQNA
ncbi:hypothetical protein Sjap_009104 [Stephania japonica]|uniref:Uncharacterized protein n=1 Tax=Stephania japonica TaxID=461633 RepID=A0AAP0JT33_9MAGN